MLRTLTWLISLALHASIALFFLMPAGNAALEMGGGQDAMVVEQGLALEGMAKLGEDEASVKAVEATPVEATAATPPEEVQPVEDAKVIASAQGPEQDIPFDPKPEKIKPVPPQPVVEPQPEQVQPLPRQRVATLQQETMVEQHQSSGNALLGGDTTARSAYLGALRSRLERAKINPRSGISGTTVVDFVVDADGRVISREVRISSGHKVLDDAALASIDKASPFPPMPKALNQAQIEVSVPFRFSTR
jgi:periplasmic protein TonB